MDESIEKVIVGNAKGEVKIDGDMINIKKNTDRNLDARSKLSLDFSSSNKLKKFQMDLSRMEVVANPKTLAERMGVLG